MATTATGSIPTQKPQPPVIAPSDMRVIWLLLVAAFVAILNETTMGIAIPHLNTDLGIPPELGQWLTSAFMLTMAIVIPTTGFLLQRFTTRQVFIAAMSAFTLGTLVCLLAPGFTVLLVGRVIQAGGTGIMMPLLMTTMMNVVPPQSRGRMMGRVGLVISLAPAIGPTLAGAVLNVTSWRVLFAIVLPIALIALAMGAKWMTNLGETTDAPIDVLSIVLSAFGFGGVVYGLSQFGGEGESGGATIGVVSLIVGGIALALFVWRQIVLQRVDDALLDLRVFRSRNYTLAVIVMAILAMSMFGTLVLLPQYLQNVAGLDALQSGLVLLPRFRPHGTAGTDHGSHLRRPRHAHPARPRHDHGLGCAVLLLDGRRAHHVVAAGDRAVRHVGGTGDVVHPAVLVFARVAAPSPVLARLCRAEHHSAGRRRCRCRTADGGVLVDPARR